MALEQLVEGQGSSSLEGTEARLTQTGLWRRLKTAQSPASSQPPAQNQPAQAIVGKVGQGALEPAIKKVLDHLWPRDGGDAFIRLCPLTGSSTISPTVQILRLRCLLIAKSAISNRVQVKHSERGTYPQLETLPKAQRTRGLSPAYQSNFLGLITTSCTNLIKFHPQILNQTSAFRLNFKTFVVDSRSNNLNALIQKRH